MTIELDRFRIPVERQGQTGLGQGGYTCWRFAQAIGETVTTALRRPLPIDAELSVRATGDGRWALVRADDPDGAALLEATRWAPDVPATMPVAISEAADARARFPMSPESHPAPHCISCGIGERTLGVHAGPLDDGRWATPLRLPEWSLIDGAVDESLLWMAIDCACGWYTSGGVDADSRGVTVQYAVDVLNPIEPETDYALVAWHGDYSPQWDGRKRGAAAAVFSDNGALVAHARSFWVRPGS